RLRHRPREMSGGEMQRAAIARALINRPRVLLADEPTGNLDEETGQQIVSLLHDLNRQDGLTIVMVTHNRDIAVGTDRVVRLAAGRVESPTPPPAPSPRRRGGVSPSAPPLRFGEGTEKRVFRQPLKAAQP